jgi:hypothetical protein
MRADWCYFEIIGYGNIAIIMGTFRCTSRSIVLKIALRSLSRCTLAAGQKQKPQKVESTALHDQQNSGGVYLPLFMGVLFALHQKPNKTKARTNADIKPDPLQV